MISSLRSALAASGYLGTWETDLSTQVVAFSGRIADLFDLDPQTASAGVPVTAFLDGIHPDDRASVARLVHEAHRTAGSFEAEFRTVGRGGRTRWVLARGRVEEKPQGIGLRCLGVIVDVTESREADPSDEAQDMRAIDRIVEALIEIRPLAERLDSPLLGTLIDAALFELGTRLADGTAFGGAGQVH